MKAGSIHVGPRSLALAVVAALCMAPSGSASARPPGFKARLAAEGVSVVVAPECWRVKRTLTCALYGVRLPRGASCSFGGAVTTFTLKRRGHARRSFVCVDEGFHGWPVLRVGRTWRSGGFRCRHQLAGEGVGRHGKLRCRNAAANGFTVDGFGRTKRFLK